MNGMIDSPVAISYREKNKSNVVLTFLLFYYFSNLCQNYLKFSKNCVSIPFIKKARKTIQNINGI